MLQRLYQKCIYRAFYVILILILSYIIFNGLVFPSSSSITGRYVKKNFFENPVFEYFNQNKETQVTNHDETYGSLIKKFQDWYEEGDFRERLTSEDGTQIEEEDATVDIEVRPLQASHVDTTTPDTGPTASAVDAVSDARRERDQRQEVSEVASAEIEYRNTNSTVILDLDRISFLPEYRNPCWLEPLPKENPYTSNRYGGKKQGYMSNLTPSWDRLYTESKSKDRTVRLRCLPYFFVGGFPKCGTTDVYDKLIHHPLIEGCMFKEPHYWTRWRFWTDKCFWRQFLCVDGWRCLPDTWQCDGKAQCKDGSDEWQCDPPRSCELENGGCSHYCNVTADGARCSCPRGYQLKPDKKTCVGGVPLSNYIDLFDVAAEKIYTFKQLNEHGENFHPKITGEATPATFWDNHRWHDEPSNDGNKNEPTTLTAHVITHLLPSVRNIVMVRNPTNRLYSDMLYFSPYTTPSDFHSKVEKGVKWFTNCTEHHTLRSCVYEPMDRRRPPEGRYWHPVERLRIGMYSEYLEDWLTIVPTSHIKVVRLEDYSADRVTSLAEITNFLNLEPMPDNIVYKWQSNAYRNSGAQKYQRQGEMLDETRELLNKFYQPFNKKLATLLNDDRFLYEE